MKPTIGKIVIYKLTETDAEQINRRRTNGLSILERIKVNMWPLGAQAHIGNAVKEGEEFPLVVTKISWSSYQMVNGQALLDSNDVLWIVNCEEGDTNGTWHSPIIQQEKD